MLGGEGLLLLHETVLLWRINERWSLADKWLHQVKNIKNLKDNEQKDSEQPESNQW